ncbi:Pogo transposable element with KRAB domain [Hondaea fermentalgiana]|uniref:Pogo transposable element with KRAB domain n=1 Tax=Hondaea fermentalgiana TaxID=2315210 RepID=A0A2R5GRR9_9STRA|nr:Pogo transposable element with KRAB domain [Hondaea fermentalgiana]|eukprot:GBG33577.1 Pogo transposable element with KRAB domain [Hondaea fermentalgiana]
MASTPGRLVQVPPFRFAVVSCGRTSDRDECLYRGAYPSLRNFPFLSGLGLASVVSIVKGGLSGLTVDLIEFCKHERIRLIVINLGEESKIPSVASVTRVLGLLADRRNLPAYVHCVDGGLATGVFVMCLRMMQHWSIESMSAEYSRFVKEGNVPSEVRNFVVSTFRASNVDLPVAKRASSEGENEDDNVAGDDAFSTMIASWVTFKPFADASSG